MASSSWLWDLLGAVFVFQHALAPSSFCQVCVSMLYLCLLPVEHLKHAGCLLLILSAAPNTDLVKVWISSPCHAPQNTHLLVLLEQALWLCTEISHLVNRRIAATAK